MKTESAEVSSTAVPANRKLDHSKLVSLLALASGAVAMPQTSDADIIYTDLSSAPAQVGFSGTSQFVINNLPGGAFLRFYRGIHQTTTPFIETTNFVAVAGSSRRYLGVKHNANGSAAVVRVISQPGPLWSQIAGAAFAGATMALSTFFGGHTPSSYDHNYLAFEFLDTTHGGRATYGWVNVSLGYTGNGPDVTIFGYAYDDAGNQIPMGATVAPEPSSMAILALGALTLGAAGVRSWRRNRAAVSQ